MRLTAEELLDASRIVRSHADSQDTVALYDYYAKIANAIYVKSEQLR